jgi:SAM-dependent methyltransferase/uncharacterized protein YbaR (Trm112 family)
MWRKLLDVLADPSDGEPLHLRGDNGTDPVTEGELVSKTGASFPIVRGVPRFTGGGSYASSFGLQWNRFATAQLDSATGLSYSRQRFDSEVGWGSDLAGRWVVDAGCGSGRFAEIAASYGAEVIAVDLSEAVDAAADNLAHRPNVHVIQADIRHLPLRRGSVRYLYSIGVLQHTPDPVASAEALVRQLPVGGNFCFTIYGRGTWTMLYSKYWLRPVTRRMDPAHLLTIIEKTMPVLFPVTTVLFSLPVVGRAFRFAIPVANYVDRTDAPERVRYEEAVLDTFDMLSPRYDHPITAEELWAGLTDAAVTVDSRVPLVVHGTCLPPSEGYGPRLPPH